MSDKNIASQIIVYAVRYGIADFSHGDGGTKGLMRMGEAESAFRSIFACHLAT